MKRAALYVRVSTTEQKLHGMSVDSQIQALQEYCQEHGYHIHDIYNDAGFSARKSYKKRPALQRMMEDCRNNKIDIVLFTRLDRFFRSVKDYYECISQMSNTPWRAIWEDYETETPDGIFKVNIMLSVAQSEADKTSARLKDSYSYRKAKGIYIGRPPVGYLIEDGRLVKDPATQDGVQELFDTYLETLSTSKAMQVAANYGISLNRASFPKLLKNPTYSGLTKNGHRCEPYITPEQQELIRTVKHSRKVKNAHPDRVYAFSGVLVCGYCGRRMVGKTRIYKLSDGSEAPYTRYVCQGDLSTINKCPDHLEISEPKMEQIMLTRLDIEIGRLKHSVELSKRDVANKIKARQRLENKLTRAKEMYIEGEITKDTYKEKKLEIERDLSMIHIEKQKVPELPREWKSIYEELTPANKQLYWKKIIDRVVLTNENKDAPTIIFRV